MPETDICALGRTFAASSGPLGALPIFKSVYLISKLRSCEPRLFSVARPASFPSSTMAEIHDQFDTILILDFGSQVCFRSVC